MTAPELDPAEENQCHVCHAEIDRLKAELAAKDAERTALAFENKTLQYIVDAAKSELATANERLAACEKALGTIAHPVAALQREAKADGLILNGMIANALADNPDYLRSIAREALVPPPPTGGEA